MAYLTQKESDVRLGDANQNEDKTYLKIQLTNQATKNNPPRHTPKRRANKCFGRAFCLAQSASEVNSLKLQKYSPLDSWKSIRVVCQRGITMVGCHRASVERSIAMLILAGEVAIRERWSWCQEIVIVIQASLSMWHRVLSELARILKTIWKANRRIKLRHSRTVKNNSPFCSDLNHLR